MTKSTFDNIKALFPKVHSLPVTCNEGTIAPCQLCQKEEESLSILPIALMSLVEEVGPILSSLPTHSINDEMSTVDDDTWPVNHSKKNCVQRYY